MELSKTKPIEVILFIIALFVIYKIWVEPPEEKESQVQENIPSIIYYETNYGKNIVEENVTTVENTVDNTVKNAVENTTVTNTVEETNTIKNEVNTVKQEVVFH